MATNFVVAPPTLEAAPTKSNSPPTTANTSTLKVPSEEINVVTPLLPESIRKDQGLNKKSKKITCVVCQASRHLRDCREF